MVPPETQNRELSVLRCERKLIEDAQLVPEREEDPPLSHLELIELTAS